MFSCEFWEISKNTYEGQEIRWVVCVTNFLKLNVHYDDVHYDDVYYYDVHDDDADTTLW